MEFVIFIMLVLVIGLALSILAKVGELEKEIRNLKPSVRDAMQPGESPASARETAASARVPVEIAPLPFPQETPSEAGPNPADTFEILRQMRVAERKAAAAQIPVNPPPVPAAPEQLATPVPPPVPKSEPRPVPSAMPPPVPVMRSEPVIAKTAEPAPERKVETPPTKIPEIPRPVAIAPGAAQDEGFKLNLEQLVGGKAASFVGIAALITGIVMFVGYAIQHQWIGPAGRVLMGLFSGVALIVLGHFAETRGKNLRLLARVLTGGGASLFYFSVFSAYHMYHLISPVTAAACLAASAAGVFWLSVVYGSEAVAMLGLVGAFLTPQLAGGDFAHGIFPLAFIAVVDAPAIVLGIRRKWLVLANSAFVLSALMTVAWLFAQPPGMYEQGWRTPLAFCCLYYAEFLVLSVARMKAERSETGYWVDSARLALGGLGIMATIYGMLDAAHIADSQGIAFAIAAAAHGALIFRLRRDHPVVKDEMLLLWVIAILFAALAIPLHFHGVWISLGWAVAAAIICQLALTEKSRALTGLALGIGLLAVTKSLFYDFTYFAVPPRMFLNPRFAVGIATAGLLYVQSRLHRRVPQDSPSRLDVIENLPALSAFFVTACAVAEVFWTQDKHGILAWMMTSGILLSAGITFTAAGRKDSKLFYFGLVLLPLVPLKILLIDSSVTWHDYDHHHRVLLNGILWLRLGMMLAAGWWFNRCVSRLKNTANVPFNLIASMATIAAMLILLTCDFARIEGLWRDSLITLLWSASAMLITGYGIARGSAAFRNTGIALLLLVPLKVLFIDASATWNEYAAQSPVLANGLFWLRFAMMLVGGWWLQHAIAGENKSRQIPLQGIANAISIAAMLVLTTVELWRMNDHWRDSLVTLLWASSAMAMVAFGLVRHRPYFRYAGLLLFCVTAAKVFLLDFAGLSGLPRIGAFIGVGILLLILSFAYQRIAPVLSEQKPDKPV
jgi:uncharacterized membrane protein